MSREIDSLKSKIHNDSMNSICFDCGNENPVFVSINNGIFLCNQCATVHLSFPQGVSVIENNDLNSLTENELKFLALGGNTHLNDFILDEFPKLENYSQKLLYKTRGMDYYRKRLDYYVNGGIEPKKPSQIIACQLIPDNFYSQNAYTKKIPQKYEPKTRTYRPQNIQSRKYNINKKNNENEFDDDDEEFFRDPFLNEDKFGMDEGNMFKKFFGNDFFDDDDFGFGGSKINNTQKFENKTHYQEKPKTYYTNAREPKDNLSKSTYPGVNPHKVQQRPLTASNPIFVPSRKHKYIKKEEQNNSNENQKQNIQKGGTVNPMRYTKGSYGNANTNLNTNVNTNINETSKYNPFKRRDSTELITLPGNENSNLLQNKRKQKPQEIPLEFHKQASGLGQITDAINENDEESLSGNESQDSSEELAKIPENNTHKDVFDENQITFKNSIRNKYKKRKSEQMEKLRNEEEIKNPRRKNNVYESKYSKNSKTGKSETSTYNKKPSNYEDQKNRKNININIDGTNTQFDRKFVRRLSKMKISSTNWNINQLGDMKTYPDVLDVEE